MQGVEADFAALLFKGFTLRASVAYADGKNTDYPAGPCPLEVQTAATVACDLTGVRLAGLSKWAGTLGLRLPDVRWAAATCCSTWIRARAPATTATRPRRSTRRSTATASPTRASAIASPSGWEVDVFARNLFDKDYITALTIQTGNSGLILGQPSDPRIVGVTFRRATY